MRSHCLKAAVSFILMTGQVFTFFVQLFVQIMDINCLLWRDIHFANCSCLLLKRFTLLIGMSKCGTTSWGHAVKALWIWFKYDDVAAEYIRYISAR